MHQASYIAPTLSRLNPANANGQRHGPVPLLEQIDGVAVETLIADYGSPLFVFSEASVRGAMRRARHAFESRYPDVHFAWSYKTNYLNAICRLFHQEGAMAEVVSGFEYAKARANGMTGDRIIFNGPWKDLGSLRRAVAEGALIQLDHREEILALAQLAEQEGRDLAVGIRVHLDAGAHELWSKFGFNADSDEALRTVAWIQAHTRLRVIGLHCHLGTFIQDAAVYQRAATTLVHLALAMESRAGIQVSYLNLGGGFASPVRLHGQVLHPDQVTPSFDDYAQQICSAIKQHWPAARPLPRLILEAGRALIDAAGYLITSVVAVKSPPRLPQLPSSVAYGKHGAAWSSLPEVSQAVVVDSGVHLLYTSAWLAPTIHTARPPLTPPRATAVYGCLCMNIDRLREQAPLPVLAAGDPLVLHPVGAYNLSQWMQFITYRPAVVLIDLQGHSHCIRRAETLADVEGPEQLPDYLHPTAPDPVLDPGRTAPDPA